MSDLKKRIKTIEGKLDMNKQDEVIVIHPMPFTNPDCSFLHELSPRREDETDAAYLARMNDRKAPDDSPREVIRSGSVTIILPRRHL